MARDFFVNGDSGEFLRTIAFPDSTLEGYLDTAFAASPKTKMTKKLVAWSTGANFEVAVCAENGVIQGRIVGVDPYIDSDGTSTYKLTVEWFWYVDAASAKYPATKLVVLPYSGSAPSLGNTVAAYGSTYTYAKDYTSLGAGRVVGVDSTNSKVSVVM